jgi:hypothetical protein
VHIRDTAKFLAGNGYRPHSVQACLVKRDYIEENALSNPVGGLGQDSLFFTEMCLAGGCAEWVNTPVHVYFAEREDSVVNTVSGKFFERFLLTEKSMVDMLKERGRFDDYVRVRLDEYVRGWYMEKLKRVAPEEKEACESVLGEILALYGRKLPEYL